MGHGLHCKVVRWSTQVASYGRKVPGQNVLTCIYLTSPFPCLSRNWPMSTLFSALVGMKETMWDFSKRGQNSKNLDCTLDVRLIIWGDNKKTLNSENADCSRRGTAKEATRTSGLERAMSTRWLRRLFNKTKGFQNRESNAYKLTMKGDYQEHNGKPVTNTGNVLTFTLTKLKCAKQR